MTKKLFVILGNQLFDIKHLQKFKKDHIFFICEDIGLCTYEKHHKHKILFFLSAMRSFYDELVSHSFEVVYKKIDEDDATTEYMDKILDEVKVRNIKEVSVFEIEDKPFESRFIEKLEKSVSINFIKSPTGEGGHLLTSNSQSSSAYRGSNSKTATQLLSASP